MPRRFYLRINRSIVKLACNIFNFHILCVISRHPNVETVGMSNLCGDGRFVPFLDYDNVALYIVLDEVKRLQKEWGFGSAAILSTSSRFDVQGKEYGNWHVIGFGKMTFYEHAKMLESSSCDPNFRDVPQMSSGRYWTLRVAPKVEARQSKVGTKAVKGMPMLKRVLYDKIDREMSRPHYMFLRNVYGMPDLPKRYMGKLDRLKVLKTVAYKTTA